MIIIFQLFLDPPPSVCGSNYDSKLPRLVPSPSLATSSYTTSTLGVASSFSTSPLGVTSSNTYGPSGHYGHAAAGPNVSSAAVARHHAAYVGDTAAFSSAYSPYASSGTSTPYSPYVTGYSAAASYAADYGAAALGLSPYGHGRKSRPGWGDIPAPLFDQGGCSI